MFYRSIAVIALALAALYVNPAHAAVTCPATAGVPTNSFDCSESYLYAPSYTWSYLGNPLYVSHAANGAAYNRRFTCDVNAAALQPTYDQSLGKMVQTVRIITVKAHFQTYGAQGLQWNDDLGTITCKGPMPSPDAGTQIVWLYIEIPNFGFSTPCGLSWDTGGICYPFGFGIAFPAHW